MKTGKKTFSIHPVVSKSIVAIAEQGILSLGNFIASILLIKYLLKVEYGYYSIAIPILMLMLAIQNALINTPMSVLLIVKKPLQSVKYFNGLKNGMIGIGLILVLFILLFTLSVFLFSSFEYLYLVVIGLMVAILGQLCKEFITSYYYAKYNPNKAFLINLLYVVFFSVFLFLGLYYLRINLFRTFLLMGIVSLIVIISTERSNFFRIKHLKNNISSSFKENWDYGKWSLGGVIVTNIRSYSHLYLLGILLSAGLVAEVSAPRLIFMPLLLLPNGFGKIIRTRGSKLIANGKISTLKKEILLGTFLMIAISIGFSFLILSFPQFIQNTFFSPKYLMFSKMLPLWAVYITLSVISQNAEYGLQALQKFNILFKIGSVLMVVNLISMFTLIIFYGAEGSLYALIFTGVLSVGIHWIFFFKSLLSH